MFNVTKNSRGFTRVDFIDVNGANGSIQESSAATDDFIWLGKGDERLHLDKEMAGELSKMLAKFSETGEL